MFLRALIIALMPFALAHARKNPPPTPAEIETTPATAEEPWFTGSLLSFAPAVVPIGYMNLEAYFPIFDFFGEYNKHWHAQSVPRLLTISPIFFFQTGLSESIEIAALPQLFYNQSRGQSFVGIGDLPIGLGFQLLTEKEGSWRPSIKLIAQETFPLGKYQHLNPKKMDTDSIGLGSYLSMLGFSIGKLFHISGVHYFAPRFNFLYTYHSPVHVRGFNAYGGGFGTRGKVRPGNSFTALFAMECSLTRNWTFALDVDYIHFDKTRFSGKKGVDEFGAPASVTIPSSEQFSLAPAIEYNFSEKLGIIAGSWFSIGGRNADQFVSGIIALNFYTNIRPEKKPIVQPAGGAGGR